MSQKSINNEEEAGLIIAAIILQGFLQEPPDMELREALKAWIEEHPEAGEVLGELGDTAVLVDKIEDYERLVNSQERLYSKLRATTAAPIYYLSGGIAASLLIVASVFMFKYSSPREPVTPPRAAVIRDLAPGTNKAVLTLADGKAIILDSAHSGITLEQGQSITTGRGGQYHLVLSDGTKVWLDAASSLKYPTAFSGATREVVLTGEGFFQVAHHPEPFIVHTRGADVQDLGTAFNINAYPDEEGIKTTLLEGRVEISPGAGRTIILRPAQQARILPGGVCQVTDDVDTAEAIAWKEGMFQFNGVEFGTVLRYLSRWYDVRVIDQTGLAGQHVFIALSRNSPLSAFMHLLELTHKLNYQIADSGKTLVITP